MTRILLQIIRTQNFSPQMYNNNKKTQHGNNIKV